MKQSTFFTKKSSKISLKLSQIEGSNSIKERENSYNQNNIYNIIPIKVHLLLDFDNNTIKTYEFDFSEDTPVSHVILSTIENFNNDDYQVKVKKEMFKVELNNNYEYYMLKQSKKNNMPKIDYPPFNYESQLKNCTTNNFSLLINNKNCLIFHKSKHQSGRCSNKCFIF